MNIYTVTSISLEYVEFTSKKTGKKSTEASIKRSRCWGWYSTEEQAAAAASENRGDMYEAGYYTHIVVERHGEGVMTSISDVVGWWEFVRRVRHDNEVKTMTCSTPKGLERSVNFGLG